MDTLIQYKCPCCGGAIEFNTASQKMKCPFCDTQFDIETLKSYDEAINADKKDNMDWNTSGENVISDEEAAGMKAYSCQSCGGEIIGDDSMAASTCPYCGNRIVVKSQFAGMLKPDMIIPFKLDKNAAKEALRKHYQGKKLLPKVFKDENKIDEIKGVYVPFWLYDCDVDASIRYKATKLRTWSDSKYNYTETSYFMVNRSGNVGFEKVPVDGSSKMADDLMESIEPFKWSDSVDFQSAYLAGFLADKYDVDAEASVPRANKRIKSSTESTFMETVNGYSGVTAEQSNIDLKEGDVRYALLPVWLLNTKWNDKQYTFAMNGQTGKFVGDLPVDRGLWWKWFGIYAGIISVVAFAILMLLGL